MTHLNTALASTDAHNRIIGLGAAGSRVDHRPYRLVLFEWESGGVKREHDVALAKHLLQRVESEAGQLRLYEVGSVLHLYLRIGAQWQLSCIVRKATTRPGRSKSTTRRTTSAKRRARCGRRGRPKARDPYTREKTRKSSIAILP